MIFTSKIGVFLVKPSINSWLLIYNTTYYDQNILQKRKMVQYQQWTVILPHELLNCTVIFIQLLSSIAVHSASTYIFSASPDSTSVFSISPLLDHFHHKAMKDYSHLISTFIILSSLRLPQIWCETVIGYFKIR